MKRFESHYLCEAIGKARTWNISITRCERSTSQTLEAVYQGVEVAHKRELGAIALYQVLLLGKDVNASLFAVYGDSGTTHYATFILVPCDKQSPVGLLWHL